MLTQYESKEDIMQSYEEFKRQRDQKGKKKSTMPAEFRKWAKVKLNEFDSAVSDPPLLSLDVDQTVDDRYSQHLRSLLTDR